MNHSETKIKKIQRDRDELVAQIAIAEKAASLLRIPDIDVFVELIKEWIKYSERILLNLNPLDEHFQLMYNGNKEVKDFLFARLDGLRNADESLVKTQNELREKEIELNKQIQVVKKAEQSRF